MVANFVYEKNCDKENWKPKENKFFKKIILTIICINEIKKKSGEVEAEVY